MKGLLFVAILLLTGCANSLTRFEITSGANLASKGGFEGGTETVLIALNHSWGKDRRYHCTAMDISHISRGAPFNREKPEDYIWFVGCGLGFTLSGGR